MVHTDKICESFVYQSLDEDVYFLVKFNYFVNFATSYIYYKYQRAL